MRILSVVGAGIFALCLSASAESLRSDQTVFTPCRIGTSPAAITAECALVDVPFTHGMAPPPGISIEVQVPDSITLSVAKVSARNRPASDDPITMIAGGPGQSAQDSWPQIQVAFYPLLENRDVYLIDQRGTGNSARLDCPIPTVDLELNPDLNELRTEAAACYATQTLPTQWFTTSVAVRDLDYIREKLGVERWNLYGVSYGTRVALHYLRRFPERTRRVIVDAVVPPQKPIGPEIPLYAQAALDALFARCQQDQECNQAFPDLAKHTEYLFSSLKNTSRTVQFENITSGRLDSMEFNDKHLAATVRLLSYSSYGTAILPSMLYDAATNGNLAPFARQTTIQLGQLGDALASGMHAAVICTEDVPFIHSKQNRAASADTYLSDDIVDAMITSCSEWPSGVIDEDFHAPVVSEVPLLALSGAVDPITPPAYAEIAIEFLPNARHIVNPHQGHTQAPLGCMPSVLLQFIDGNPKELNVSCLERLQPPAIFIDANGPAP